MLELLPEFIGNHPILSLMFVGLLVLLVHNEVTLRFRGFKAVTPAQLTALINQKNAALIDVSAKGDFEKGHIVNSINVLPSTVDPQDKKLTQLKDQVVGVCCKNGVQSEQVCKKLVKAGYNQLFWLKGGVQAWAADQLPLTRGKSAK